MTHSRRKARGVAVALIVVALAVVNLAVMGVVRAGADESLGALTRVETLRAMHAADSGARVVIRSLIDGVPPPADGAETSIPGAVIRYRAAPGAVEAGDIVVEGASGGSVRRVVVSVDAP